jgi:hypothetical protein
MKYEIKDVTYLNGINLMTITIVGNGVGLRNNIILKDENDNEFFLKSIAMVSGNMKNTILSVSQLLNKGNMGKTLYVKGK